LDYFSCKCTRKLVLLPGMINIFAEPHTFNNESGSSTGRRRRRRIEMTYKLSNFYWACDCCLTPSNEQFFSCIMVRTSYFVSWSEQTTLYHGQNKLLCIMVRTSYSVSWSEQATFWSDDDGHIICIPRISDISNISIPPVISVHKGSSIFDIS
jgi:hypothetical protein